MPTLLSPRGAATAAKAPLVEEGGGQNVKKPKGVLGRIKSTFKLGRRKSSTGSSTESAAAAAVASMEKDDVDDEPESRDDHDQREEKQQEDDELVTPYDGDEATDVKQFSAVDTEEEETLQQQVDVTPKASKSEPAETKEDRVGTIEQLSANSEKNASVDQVEAAAEDEEAEEVFACDYKAGDAHHADDSKALQDDGDDEEVELFAEDNGGDSSSGSGGSSSNGNQSPPAPAARAAAAAPRESDLMVVGVSPAKFRSATGPSASPVKRSHTEHQRREKDAASASNQDPTVGPSPADTESELGDRSTRPTRQPTVPSSPVRRSQLLSDFQFGTEALNAASSVASSPVPSSPMRRRPSASPAPSTQLRRSFQRDQKQQLSINASSSSTGAASPAASPITKRKPDTPSAVPSARTSSRPERRTSLQGISEEATKPKAEASEEPRLPPRPSAGMGRRRSVNADAPILASSFAVASPEVHDDHAAVEDHGHLQSKLLTSENDDDHHNHDERPREADTGAADSGVCASTFDAGAAITHAFGERVARLLGADPWGDRQDGFDAIVFQIKKTDLAAAKNKRELFCATITAVQCGVEDRVAPVMYCALDCLRAVLKEFAPALDRSFLKLQPMNEQLSALTKAIVAKLGDSNKRTQREASQAVVRLAKLKKLKVLPHVLLHLSAKEVAPRQRVETLRVLVKELGVDNQTAMNVEVVMQFAVPVLKIADEKTRKAAVELIAELHMVNGQAVNAQLTGVKPEMLRVINRRVDEFLAKKEEERQQQQATQSANQTEEAGQESGQAAAMALVAVPAEESKAVEALLDAMAQQAQSVLGPVAWRKLESKTWSDRKEALVDMEKTLTEAKSDLRDVKPAFHSVVQNNFLAYCTVVYRCLSDSIAPVVNSAMDGFSTLVKVYGPCVEWRDDTVRELVMLTIMRLFATMQKPNSRTNRAACRCILKLARLTNPHTLRYALSCMFAKDTDALVQLHLLRLLVPEFGFQSDGISASLVLDTVALGLGHTSDKVRKTATDVALCTQRLVGKELVLKKLKDVVKPVTLKELEKNFVDVEIQNDGERPQTVHASAASASLLAALPPVQFGGEHSRRLLNSAPVGLGKLHCTPPHEEQERGSDVSFCQASVLSNDEENLMDSILGSDDC